MSISELTSVAAFGAPGCEEEAVESAQQPLTPRKKSHASCVEIVHSARYPCSMPKR